MKVKIFDEEDEVDLENDVNEFLDNLDGEVVDIKYQVSVGVFSEEQVFCFSAMIVYSSLPPDRCDRYSRFHPPDGENPHDRHEASNPRVLPYNHIPPD